MGVVSQAVSTVRTEMTQCLGMIDGRLGTIETKQTDLESRVAHLESKPGQGSQWAPTYVEVKGFCKFDERKDLGIDRPGAAALYQVLKNLLPADLQAKVGEFQLTAARNHSIRIPVQSDVILEISNTWNDHLKTPSNTWMNSQNAPQSLFAVRQRPPEVQKRFEVFGRLLNFVESEHAGDISYDIRAFWTPSFQIFAEPSPSGTAAVEIVSVGENSVVTWHAPGLQYVKKRSEAEARTAFLQFKRPRQ